METYHYRSEGGEKITLPEEAIKEIREVKFIPAHTNKGLGHRIPNQTIVNWLRRIDRHSVSLDFTAIAGKDAKRAYKELTIALKALQI